MLSDKRIQKDKTPVDQEPMDAFRSIHFRKDTRSHSDKLYDSVADAGQETRSTNQIVKLVNLHLNERMKHLQKIKDASKKFDDEVNMFTSSAKEENLPQSKSIPGDTETQALSNELATLISKHGFKKLSDALELLLSQNPDLKDRI